MTIFFRLKEAILFIYLKKKAIALWEIKNSMQHAENLVVTFYRDNNFDEYRIVDEIQT